MSINLSDNNQTKLIGWIARDNDGFLGCYDNIPSWDERRGEWLVDEHTNFFGINKSNFAYIKAGEEPRKVVITIETIY